MFLLFVDRSIFKTSKNIPSLLLLFPNLVTYPLKITLVGAHLFHYIDTTMSSCQRQELFRYCSIALVCTYFIEIDRPIYSPGQHR